MLPFRPSRINFLSDFPLAESVARLRAAVVPTHLRAQFRLGSSAVGWVSASRVDLQRVIPFVGNAFKQHFFGSFTEHGGRVVLTGVFTMPPGVKALLALAFGLGAVFAVLAFTRFLGPRPEEGYVGLAVVAIMAGGAVLVQFGRALAGNDPAWLAEFIRRALRDGG
jgi:hypothetical protein